MKSFLVLLAFVALLFGIAASFLTVENQRKVKAELEAFQKEKEFLANMGPKVSKAQAEADEAVYKEAVTAATAMIVVYCATNGPFRYGTTNDIAFLTTLPDVCWWAHTNRLDLRR